MRLFQEERQNLITQFISDKGRVTIHSLAKELNVSIPTIRRDLTELNRKGMIRRSHGGAIAKDRVLEEISFEKRLKKFHQEKIQIAKYAVSMIKEKDVIILDTGTTNYWIASLLKNRKNITVITNSLKAAVELSSNKDIRHILIGGYILPETFSIYGPSAVEDIKKFNADKVFLGTTGIHWEKGLTEIYGEEASMKKIFLEISREKIVVTDHSKLGIVSFAHVAPLSKIDMVISDSGVDAKIKRKFENTGPKFVYL